MSVPFGVLISGSGTNLQALIDATRVGLPVPPTGGMPAGSPERSTNALSPMGAGPEGPARGPGSPARIAVVISNRADAYGLERARAAGIPAVVLPSKGTPREAYDAALVEQLRAHGVEWVAMAGFMRLVTPVLLDAFPGRILNIHPALLPAFPGLHVQEQAFAHGVRIAGATVHLVDGGTDTGPIVAQGAVPVLPGDDVDALKARILRVEHRLYPMVVRWAAEGRLRVVGRKVSLDLPEGEHAFLFDATP